MAIYFDVANPHAQQFLSSLGVSSSALQDGILEEHEVTDSGLDPSLLAGIVKLNTTDPTEEIRKRFAPTNITCDTWLAPDEIAIGLALIERFNQGALALFMANASLGGAPTKHAILRNMITSAYRTAIGTRYIVEQQSPHLEETVSYQTLAHYGPSLLYGIHFTDQTGPALPRVRGAVGLAVTTTGYGSWFDFTGSAVLTTLPLKLQGRTTPTTVIATAMHVVFRLDYDADETLKAPDRDDPYEKTVVAFGKTRAQLYPSRLAVGDDLADLAIFVPTDRRLAQRVPPLPVAAALPPVGEQVWVVGFPANRQEKSVRTYTTGTFEGTQDFGQQAVLRVMAWHGDSGGALLNKDGALLGVLTKGVGGKCARDLQRPTYGVCQYTYAALLPSLYPAKPSPSPFVEDE